MIVLVGVLISTVIVGLTSALVAVWQARKYMKEKENKQ